MEHEKSGSDESSSTEAESHDEVKRPATNSVTDLIDSIERKAFKRYVSTRVLRRQFGWISEQRADR